MPQQRGLIGQRGSVLAGVLVFSVILTLAAGGFLLTSSIAQSSAYTSVESRKLQLAGESVMQMAMRYMRDEARATLRGDNPDDPGTWTAITPGYPGWTQIGDVPTRTALGNPLIKAAFQKNAGGGVTVHTWAAFPGAPSMIQITWRITDATEGGPSGMRNLVLEDWKDTLVPRSP